MLFSVPYSQPFYKAESIIFKSFLTIGVGVGVCTLLVEARRGVRSCEAGVIGSCGLPGKNTGSQMHVLCKSCLHLEQAKPSLQFSNSNRKLKVNLALPGDPGLKFQHSRAVEGGGLTQIRSPVWLAKVKVVGAAQ